MDISPPRVAFFKPVFKRFIVLFYLFRILRKAVHHPFKVTIAIEYRFRDRNRIPVIYVNIDKVFENNIIQHVVHGTDTRQVF